VAIRHPDIDYRCIEISSVKMGPVSAIVVAVATL
jgi:hypothetical protein